MTENKKVKISVKPNFQNNEIEIVTDIMGSITREVADLKEQAVRQALIDMGWTPPAERCKDTKDMFE